MTKIFPCGVFLATFSFYLGTFWSNSFLSSGFSFKSFHIIFVVFKNLSCLVVPALTWNVSDASEVWRNLSDVHELGYNRRGRGEGRGQSCQERITKSLGTFYDISGSLQGLHVKRVAFLLLLVKFSLNGLVFILHFSEKRGKLHYIA